MSDEPVPMLNKPKESTSETAERFAENVLGRMDRAHASFIDKSHLVEPHEQQLERIEKWKQEIIARVSEMTGLEFNQDGKCITPGARMDARFNRVWAELCGQLAVAKDPEQKEQLWRQAGAILRGEETGTPEPKPTDSTDS